MWFLQQLDPANNSYNSNLLLRLKGGIDPLVLEQALQATLLRHQPLRTLYPNVDGEPVQMVRTKSKYSLPIKDLSGLPEPEKLLMLEKEISRLADEPFDLQTGPLTRSALFHLSNGEDVLFFGTHHVGSDAWSREVFQHDLLQAHADLQKGGEVSLFPLPVQYTDYALWQREWMQGETLSTYLNHWKDVLKGDLPTLELPTDRPRPLVQTFRGRRHTIPLPAELVTRIKVFCRQERVTSFHFYLAAFSILLMRYSGQEDVIIGCPFANRHAPELENMVGLFINAMPIRIDLSTNPSVRDLLVQVRQVMIDAFTWQALPFETLISELSPERDLSRTPIYQVSINMRNILRQIPVNIEGLQVEQMAREEVPAPLDLSLEFEDAGGQQTAFLQYNTDLFDADTIARMAAHYLNLVTEMITNPDATLSSLKMLSAAEWQQLVVDWNQTDAEFPQECMHNLVSSQAAQTPEKTAVVFNRQKLTYRELDMQANQLANHLLKSGLQPGSFVSTFLPRSERNIICLLAILKTGCAFVPLDYTMPGERLVAILNDASPALVLTDATSVSRLPPDTKSLLIDEETSTIDQCSGFPPAIRTDPGDNMYVMYTSGSTGSPKGVLSHHRGSVNYLSYMVHNFGFSPADRLLQHTSLSFDASVFEIFVTLISGGTLVMLDDNHMSNPASIVYNLLEKKVTVLKVVPTMLRAVCESAMLIGQEKYALRLLLVVGEPLLLKDLQLAHQVFGDELVIINQYGPTECSGIYTNFVVPNPFLQENLPSIPIGRPMSNNKTYLLDHHLNPVPVGVLGELYLGGVGVGPGYLNQPYLTAQAFLPDPFLPGSRMYKTGDIVRQLPDGNYVFTGRADNQVKIRGYRVELGEIETAIREYPGVNHAAVLLWKSLGSETLVAYITPNAAPQENILEQLQQYLSARLPFYMIPPVIMVLDEFPLTISGKLDRKRLPAPEKPTQQASAVAPRNETETRLLEIWKTVLETDGFGVTDNFFQLGGHSLLAVRLMTAVQKEFGKSIPLMLLFQEGTVEGLAKFLSARRPQKADGIVPINTDGEGIPIFIVSSGLGMKYLGSELGNTHPLYALFAYENGKPAYRGTVQESAEVYYRCLLSFQPDGPYCLLGHSADGHFALELARLLRQNGKTVTFLGLIDSYPPAAKQQLNPGKRLDYYLRSLKKNNFRGVLRTLWRSLRWRVDKYLNQKRGAKEVEDWQRRGEVRRVKHFLMKAYQPETYDGDITLFSATYALDVTREEMVRQWEKVIRGRIEVIPVLGDHTSVVQPPHVAALGKVILEAIDGMDEN